MTEPDDFPINTLMMIDDSSFDQMVYQRISKKSGLVQHLLQFLDANDALECLADPAIRNPDLILLDINMPKMDGFEFLEAATERFGTAICPIIMMLTTSLNPRDIQRIKSFKIVHDFLNKPLTQDQLKALSHIVRAETHT